MSHVFAVFVAGRPKGLAMSAGPLPNLLPGQLLGTPTFWGVPLPKLFGDLPPQLYAIPCYIMSYNAMPYEALLCYVMLCHAILCDVLLGHTMFCYVLLCYAIRCDAMLGHFVFTMLCYAMLSYVML